MEGMIVLTSWAHLLPTVMMYYDKSVSKNFVSAVLDTLGV